MASFAARRGAKRGGSLDGGVIEVILGLAPTGGLKHRPCGTLGAWRGAETAMCREAGPAGLLVTCTAGGSDTTGKEGDAVMLVVGTSFALEVALSNPG